MENVECYFHSLFTITYIETYNTLIFFIVNTTLVNTTLGRVSVPVYVIVSGFFAVLVTCREEMT